MEIFLQFCQKCKLVQPLWKTVWWEFAKNAINSGEYQLIILDEINICTAMNMIKVSDVKEFRVDVFVIGDDWKGKFDFLKKECEVIYLPRTPEISSTMIKQDLKEIKK